MMLRLAPRPLVAGLFLVVFAAITVVIALAGLLVVGIPFLGVMGVAAALSVITAMLAALTLLPAVMGLLKNRLAPRPRSRVAARARAALAESSGEEVPNHQPTLGERWVALVVKAPIVAILAVVGVLGTLAIPAFSLQLALPTGGQQPEGSDMRVAYDLIAEEFGEGSNGPLIVTVDITQTTEIFEQLEDISDELAELDARAEAARFDRAFWSGEAEACRAFFSVPRTPDEHARWLRMQTYKELYGSGLSGSAKGIDDVIEGLERELQRSVVHGFDAERHLSVDLGVVALPPDRPDCLFDGHRLTEVIGCPQALEQAVELDVVLVRPRRSGEG